MDIVLRCDAGGSIGLGHLMRCRALADIARAGGCGVRWVVGGDAAAKALVAEGFAVTSVAPDAGILPGALPADWVVVDLYRADEAAIRGLKPARSLVFDDHQRRQADLRVAPTEAAAPGVLGGLAHAVLRRPFAIPARRERHGLVVAMGGADSQGLAARIIGALLAVGHAGPLTVLGGSGAAADPVLAKALAAADARLVHGAAAEAVAGLFAGARAVICSSSTVALEAMACGAPVVALAWVDNQRPLADVLAAGGVPIADGPEAAVALLPRAARHPGVDGLGAWRVAAAMGLPVQVPLAQLPPRGQGAIVVEDAVESDCAAVWALNTASDVRRWSVDARPIAWDEHLRWWRGRSGRLVVARVGGIVAASGRLSADAWISVTVHAQARQRGLGAAVVRHLSAGRACLALVHRDNAASLALFAACGFRPRAAADERGFLTLEHQP